MSQLYDRKYKLVVGQPKDIIYTGEIKEIDLLNIDAVQRNEFVSDYRLDVLKAIEIVDLQIEAEISGNTSTGSQAAAIIKIYNLSDQSRAIIENVNNYVTLNAGYAQDEELAMIFSGQVFDFNTEKQGVDMVTTLKCKDGYTPNNSIRIAHKFPKGGNYEEVLTYLADVFANNGIPTGQLELIDVGENRQTFVQLRSPKETTLLRGLTIKGFLRQIMDTVCNSLGYVWYITNGRLFCHPKGFTKTVELYEFSTDQMLSIRRSGNQTTATSTGKGVEGVKIVTFLDGRLDNDKRIRVTGNINENFNGDYKVVSKSHSLNYRNGQWITTIECKKA